MATSPESSPASLTSWKLKESVKFMRINANKGDNTQTQSSSGSVLGPRSPRLGPRLVRTFGRSKDSPVKRLEIKKWKKMDIYLFKYDIPVIKYCPTGDELSQLTSESIQLNDVILVKHVPNSSKPNVLTISFPSYSLLLSFKSQSSMEQWMSELLRLTDTFTFLLYETSHSSIKPGYYQLRLVLGNFSVIVYDAITKKVEWSWHISHICSYSREKSGVKIEVGKESPTSGTFSFTGKQVELFCELIQMFGRKYSQKRTRSLPPRFSDELVKSESTPFRKRSFAMQTFPRSNAHHISDVSDINDNSFTESVFSENHDNSPPTGHPVHTFPMLNARLDMSSTNDSVTSTESVFSNNCNNIPSSPIGLSTAQTILRSNDNSKPEETQINDDLSQNESSLSQSDINHSSLPTSDSTVDTFPKSDGNSKTDENTSASLNESQNATSESSLPCDHSKSLDDLLQINPVHKSSRICVSNSELDKVNDDSDDEDYVIPFLYNSDEDGGYVIASLFPCPTGYLTVQSNSEVDNYAEVKDLTLQTLSLSATCEDDFRTRSDSDAYDYVKDFILPLSPLSPSNTCVKHDTPTRLNSDINDYEDIKEVLEETPTSSTACISDDHPVKLDPDYEEVENYLLQVV